MLDRSTKEDAMTAKTTTHKQGPSTHRKKTTTSSAHRADRPIVAAGGASRFIDRRGRPVVEFLRHHPVAGAAAAAGAGLALASAIGVGELALGLAAGYVAYRVLRDRVSVGDALKVGGERGGAAREGRHGEAQR
jgi:hypothetical protein